MMERLSKRIKDVPRYGWIFAVVTYAIQMSSYYGSMLLTRILGTNSWIVAPKIPFIDDRIPIVAIFVIPYLVSLPFWLGGTVLASLTEKKNFYTYISGLWFAYFTGTLIFTFIPTYIDRVAEGLIQYSNQPGFFNFLFKVVYLSDGGNYGYCLFPSYHCMISLFCYLGVRKRNEVPKGTRVFMLVMTILICMSTVFIKQHYFIDVIGGVTHAILCYTIARKFDFATRFFKKFM